MRGTVALRSGFSEPDRVRTRVGFTQSLTPSTRLNPHSRLGRLSLRSSPKKYFQTPFIVSFDNLSCGWNFRDFFYVLNADIAELTSSWARVAPYRQRCDWSQTLFGVQKAREFGQAILTLVSGVIFHSCPETQGPWQQQSLRRNAVPTEPTVVATAVMFSLTGLQNNWTRRLEGPRRDSPPMTGCSLRSTHTPLLPRRSAPR
jgi:hypothetical protein